MSGPDWQPSPRSIAATRSKIPNFQGSNVVHEPPPPPGYFLRPDGYSWAQVQPEANKRSESEIARYGVLTDRPRCELPRYDPWAGKTSSEPKTNRNGCEPV